MNGAPELFAELAPRDGVGETRDALDRHFTPLALARVACARLAGVIAPPRSILEPSCGDGAWLIAAREVWPRAELHAVDVDPAARGLDLPGLASARCADFTAGAFGGRVDLVLGNPPFSGVQGLGHVERAHIHGRAVALILPWSFLGGVKRWAPYMTGDGAPAFAWPVAPRPWGLKLRESALYVWRRGPYVGGVNGCTVVEPLPRWRS